MVMLIVKEVSQFRMVLQAVTVSTYLPIVPVVVVELAELVPLRMELPQETVEMDLFVVLII